MFHVTCCGVEQSSETHVLDGILNSRCCGDRWGEDASSSQPELQQQDQDNWWDENSWDGYAGDDGNESESMNLQELQSSLLEAGYAAAGSRNQHHPIPILKSFIRKCRIF